MDIVLPPRLPEQRLAGWNAARTEQSEGIDLGTISRFRFVDCCLLGPIMLCGPPQGFLRSMHKGSWHVQEGKALWIQGSGGGHYKSAVGNLPRYRGCRGLGLRWVLILLFRIRRTQGLTAGRRIINQPLRIFESRCHTCDFPLSFCICILYFATIHRITANFGTEMIARVLLPQFWEMFTMYLHTPILQSRPIQDLRLMAVMGRLELLERAWGV